MRSPESVIPVTWRESSSFTALSPRAHQNFPIVEIDALQQEHLDRAAVLGMRVQAGGQYPRTVDDEHVSRFQIVRNVAKNAVLDRFRIAVIDKQTGAVARLCGRLRDQLLGKIVPKITLFQNVHNLYFLSLKG